MDLSDDILLSILAATDALFIPNRDPTERPRCVVLYERRRDFAACGLPWASDKALPGLDEAGRKQVQRALEDLAARGEVEIFRPKGQKTIGVRLTDGAEARMRALCGLPGFDAARIEVGRLSGLIDDDGACAFLGRIYSPETALAGVRWGDNEQRHKLVELEDRLLPALVRGQVYSNCTVQGHCWYSVKPNASLPIEPGNLPVRNDAIRGGYYGRLKNEAEELRLAAPGNDREIGEIPMPVCPLPRAERLAK